MKKLFSSILLAGFSLLIGTYASGQARLAIVELDSFPQFPGDTAFEGQDYHNVRIVVTNVGNNNFFGEIKVFLYSQSIGISGIDTLRDAPSHQYLLNPGDTVSLPADNPPGPPGHYEFRIIHYAAGDNIIVVWPYSNSTLFDTYLSRVYFALITDINEPRETTLNLFPNPVSQEIHLIYEDENVVKQVRIYDLAGREVFNVHEAVRTILLSTFDMGVYFLEVIQKDGTHTVKKILVSNN